MKRYFKDMETDEKIEIILNVDDLKYKVGDKYYEELMFRQEEEHELMFGKDSYKYIDIRDNYNSFYLVLKDWNKFLDNLDKDYLCNNGLDLYNQIMVLKNEYDNIDMVENEDRYDELEELLEEKCKELLDICEQQLHEYETYNDDDLKDYLSFQLEENNMYEDLYIIDDDKTKVYEDIAYTKTYD